MVAGGLVRALARAEIMLISDQRDGHEDAESDTKRQPGRRQGAIERTGGTRRRGDTVRITRRGKPVAQITAVKASRQQIDVPALRALTDSMPPQKQSAREFVRTMRDKARY